MQNRTNQQRPPSSSLRNRPALSSTNQNSNSPLNNTNKSKYHHSCHLNDSTLQEKANKSGFSSQNTESQLGKTSKQVPLSEREINELNSKFKKLSSSIITLATSNKPVGVKSLESLLTQEITRTIGTTVLDPRYSQMFTEATRELLDNLVNASEEGRINPRLLRGEGKPKDGGHPLIKVDSASTICYRDRYFKELVMNLLQSMSSNELEKEVSQENIRTSKPTIKAADLRSPMSNERIIAIRNMVRTEAGIELDVYQGLQAELNELQQSLAEKKKELLRSMRELEIKISEHLMTHDTSTSDYVRIPGSARLVLKNCCDKKKSGLKGGCDKVATDSERDTSSLSSCTTTDKCSSQHCLNKFVKSEESIRAFGIGKGGSDEENTSKLIEVIKNNVVQGWMAYTKDDIGVTKNEYTKPIEGKVLKKALKKESSFMGNDLKSIYEDDDEITEEESKVFLQALKKNIEHKKLENVEIRNCKMKCNIFSKTVSNQSLTNSSIPSSTTVSLCLKQQNIDYPTLNIEPYYTNISSYFKEQVKINENTIKRTSSKWWSSDESIANEILREMKQAFDKIKVMSSEIINNILISDVTGNEFQTNETFPEGSMEKQQPSLINNKLDFTIEEMVDICLKISNRIDQLPQHLLAADTKYSNAQKEQLSKIVMILERCLNDSSSNNSISIFPLTDEEQFSLSIKNISMTFSILSKSLIRAPPRLKGKPVSVLDPPKSLTKTLAVLASTEYFKDCFTSGNDQICANTNTYNELNVVKPFNVAQQKSSDGISSSVPESFNSTEAETPINYNSYLPQNDNKLGEVNKYLNNFEHFLGFTPNVMTVQNLSDMLLFLSTVLNDVPHQYKGKRILSLNPPTSILNALNILYTTGDSACFSEFEKRKGFASLTVQNASDFFLTLSKAFDDKPLQVKNSSIIELNPPESLLKAVTMLTSLSQNSVLNSESQEELDMKVAKKGSESQEIFVDAYDSMTFLKCVQ